MEEGYLSYYNMHPILSFSLMIMLMMMMCVLFSINMNIYIYTSEVADVVVVVAEGGA